MVYDKEVFIQRIKYVSKRGLVDLYDHQKHLFEAEPAPFVSSICKRLMEAKTIQKELSEGRSHQDVASQRGVSISHLKKVLKLLKLPSAKRKLIENDDPVIHSLSFKQALAEAHKHEQWLSLVKALDHADHWREQMKQGVSQVDLAKEAGITRARVCQLVRLSDLSSKVKILIRKGDELYYGISLREILRTIGENH